MYQQCEHSGSDLLEFSNVIGRLIMTTSRRKFLKQSSLAGLGFVGLNTCLLSGCQLNAEAENLQSKPRRDKQQILDLPAGFTAGVISRKGDRMQDGFLTPGSHDGMGMFSLGADKLLIIRNHELTPGAFEEGPFGTKNQLLKKVNKSLVYDVAGASDRACVGGTTTLVYDERRQRVDMAYLSLVGTVRNCSGGATPWNSWISCEETAVKKGDERGLLEKDHGYNFEVPASSKISLSTPQPLKAMGRFVHESIAVHPASGVVYQTEDLADGLFYRFIPNTPGELQMGGKLQCLAIRNWKSADTRNLLNQSKELFPQNTPFETSWIDLENVESPENDLRIRGCLKGAAIFTCGEGMTIGNREVYFTCSNGGQSGKGQIFKYIPSTFEGQPGEDKFPGTLELFVESKTHETFRYCDNITMAPWGDLVICEDCSDARIIGITPAGKAYVIATNIGYRTSEFAGPVFSPSGKTLFVNIQNPGLTLAITGPWNKLADPTST